MVNNNYDIIIVGGGITGLYMCYKLAPTNKSILLLESTSDLGGRIKTIKKDGDQYEAGAVRICSTHKKTLRLLTELNLHSDLYKLPNEINTILYEESVKVDLYGLLNEVVEASKKMDSCYLDNITFYLLCVDVLGNETANHLMYAYGYDAEFMYASASSILLMYSSSLLKPKDYYALRCGLSEMIHKLYSNLCSQSNVTVQLSTEVHDVNSLKKAVLLNCSQKQWVYAQHIILTVPMKSLKKYSCLKDAPVKSVMQSCLHRIYAKYPVKDGNVWFQNIKRTTTNNILRHIIPIDPSTGLIMIIYADSSKSYAWNLIAKQGTEVLTEKIHDQIEAVFKVRPPKPLWIRNYYWEIGVHFWKPGYNVEASRKQLIQPHPNIYICGETYSKNQGWIEGCLETSFDVLETMDLGRHSFKRQLPQQIPQSQIPQSQIPQSQIPQSQIPDDSISKYTIEEVLEKKDDWIILEYEEGKPYIYDISRWISEHPGGDSIRRGTKANAHYLDKQTYPKKPIELFLSQGIHRENQVIETYLKKKNKWVQFVGILVQ
jgi:protoporphyrinogen oxidase